MTSALATEASRLEASGTFDADWYAGAYPDVAESGMTPAEHFLWLGASLGRSPLPPARLLGMSNGAGAAVDTNDGDVLDALFIDGTGGTASTSYRVQRIAAALADQGWAVRCASGQQVSLHEFDAITARFLIIHRAGFQGDYPALVDRMRSRGSVIVYDVDDLIFDEDLIPFVDAYLHMSATQQRAFRASIGSCRDFVLASDFCTASTSYIAEAIERLGKPAFRVRNSISTANISFFKTILYRRRQRSEPFTIGYYSGTKTHQADFAVVAPALTQMMSEHDNVFFRLVGHLDLSAYPELARWQRADKAEGIPRIVRVGLMPHDVMLRDQLCCDVILAPLELGNPFCEGKSELKFFEAALTKCPTIVSPTRTFCEATQHGRLAFLASTTADWLAALRTVYDDYGSAMDRACAAFDAVCESYSEIFAAKEASAAYEGFNAWRARRASLRVGKGP